MSEEPEKVDEPIPTSNIVDMMFSGANAGGTLDTESLIKETQKRVWSSLKKGYEYDYSVDESDKFLRAHVAQKMPMIVMFVDLAGSTDMALLLPPEKLGIIISSFSQEMRFVIRYHGGYVLKYVGDAVIGYFVAEENPLVVSDNAINCAKNTALAAPNQILIGEDVYKKIHPSLKELFEKVEWHDNQWSYHNRETGKIYGVYAMHL